MGWVRDAGLLLFRGDLAIQVRRHAIELGDHDFDLRDAPPLFIDLEAFEANKRIPRLHHTNSTRRTSPERLGMAAESTGRSLTGVESSFPRAKSRRSVAKMQRRWRPRPRRKLRM